MKAKLSRLLWRNRIAHPTSNREVAGSIPAKSTWIQLLFYLLVVVSGKPAKSRAKRIMSFVAQLVERVAVNHKVVGSIPIERENFSNN